MSLAAPNWYKRHCLLNSNSPWLGVFVGGGSTKRFVGVFEEKFEDDLFSWLVGRFGRLVWTNHSLTMKSEGMASLTVHITYVLASKFKSIQ